MKRLVAVPLVALVLAACQDAPTEAGLESELPQLQIVSQTAVVLYAGTSGRSSRVPGRIYRIDVETQQVTLVTQMPDLPGSGGGCEPVICDVTDLDFDSNGLLYVVTGGSVGPAFLWTVDISDGTVNLVGEIPLVYSNPPRPLQDKGVGAIAFDADGTLYGSQWDGSIQNGKLISIDPANAGLLSDQVMFGATGNNWVPGLAFDPSGQLFGSRGNSGHLADLVKVNKFTAELTPVGAATNTISDLAFSPDGRLFGCSPTGALFEIDPTTGAKTLIFNTGIRMSGLTGVLQLTPQERIELLIGDVQDLIDASVLDPEGNGLLGIPNAALGSAQNNRPSSVAQLNAFISAIEGFISGGLLTAEQGQPLIDAALSIINQVSA